MAVELDGCQNWAELGEVLREAFRHVKCKHREEALGLSCFIYIYIYIYIFFYDSIEQNG